MGNSASPSNPPMVLRPLPSAPAFALALVLALALAASSSPAHAQSGGTSASLSGVVADTAGRVASGIEVVVRNNATSAESRAVTDGTGWFVVPALNPGTYTVTVAPEGYKKLILPDIAVISATPAMVKAILEPGEGGDPVRVEGAYSMVQTQTAAVQQTMVVGDIERYPLRTHNALDLATMLSATLTTGSGSSGTVINGLPNVTMNITLDGVNVQDNHFRNGNGFGAPIRPTLESIEQIGVLSAVPGAERTGQGAVQIQMVTRAGSNRFSGSVYNSWRNQAGTTDEDVLARSEKRGWLWRLNTPYWFNKRDRPKTPAGESFIDDVRLQMPGFRVGGPIVIPRVFDGRDKAFFFFNWESFLWPSQIARSRYLLNPSAQQGIFTYPAADGSGLKTIDVLALAGSKGQVYAKDPIVTKVLGDIRSAAAGWSAGGLAPWDLNNDKFDYSPAGDETRHAPTLRLDVNLSRNHRLTFTGRHFSQESSPDLLNNREPRFPGFANFASRTTTSYETQAAVRSAFGANLVNEARVGYVGGTIEFGRQVGPSQFDCSGLGCQGGYNLLLGSITVGTTALTPATAVTARSPRSVPNVLAEDTLTWLKGRHQVSMGASFTGIALDETWTSNVVPGIVLTLAPAAPAYPVFTASSGNFPGGISDAYATYARNLYALLTGTVNQVNGQADLGADGHVQGRGASGRPRT